MCNAFSAPIVAAYLPVNPKLLEQHLLLLLEDGETVEPIPCTEHAILWRSSLFDPAIGIDSREGTPTNPNREGRITIIDLAPSLLGTLANSIPKPKPNPNSNPNPVILNLT